MKLSMFFLSVLVMSSQLSFATEQPSKVFDIAVTETGFVPSSIDVTAGTRVTLNFKRKTDNTCATQIVVPSMKVKKDLPLNKTVSVELGRLSKGEVRFACGMKMVSGVVVAK